MNGEKLGKGEQQNSWGDMEEWAARHPFDPTLYENESAWKVANHIDDSRENIIMEAAGAIVGYESIDKAYEKAKKEKIDIYDALLDNAMKEKDTFKAMDVLDKVDQLFVIDCVEKESDWNLGVAKGMQKYTELSRKRINSAFKNGNYRNSPIDYNYNIGAMDYLDSEIENYMFVEKQKNDSKTLPEYLKQRLENIQQKANLLEEQGKWLSDSDAMTARGILQGLNFLKIVMDGYQDKKKVLDETIGDYR
ncbi:hypothetical protein IKF23_04270 [Candidatus Saccharibacteria bacterium]|nr:hypothetical protein [Candidatus Saccharibacteria bacterium]